MKAVRKVLIVIFSFILSLGIGYWISDGVGLTPKISSVFSWVQNSVLSAFQPYKDELKTEEPAPVELPAVSQRMDKPSKSGSEFRNEEHLDYYCKPAARTSVIRLKDKVIYKWVDKKGQFHYSDEAPGHAVEGLELSRLDGEKKLFNLNIHPDANMPLDFRDKLDLRVRRVYQVMEGLLPVGALQPVEVKLWLFNNHKRYVAFRKKHAPGLTGSSQGFHSSKNNIAAAYRINDQQLLSTSIHEAVHVINSGIFGKTPRWLNEGMAEYFEVLNVYSQALDIRWRPEQAKQIQRKRLALSFVFGADRSAWLGNQRTSLYAHSWGVVFYLLGSATGKVVLVDYLDSSAKSPCNLLSFNSFLAANYPGGVAGLQRDFNLWLDQPHLDQHY